MFAALQHALIFGLDYRRTYSGLLCIVKPELFERVAHSAYAHAVIAGDKGRCETDDNGIAAVKHYPDLFGLRCDLLSVLRTHDKALAAENAFISDYMCLIARKADRLYRAVAYAFIAVFAVGFFQCKTI